jgi:hypothetical protein
MHFHRAKTHISETARALMMLSAMVFASTANAGIKCWKNHEGVRECGNVVPPEFAQEGHEEKSKSGRTIGAQGRAQSAEELAAEKAEQATKAAAAEAANAASKRQAESDRVLLATFASVDDLTMARDGQLANVESQIKLSETHIKKLDKSLDQMIAGAADHEKHNRPVPKDISSSIESTRQQIADEKKFIAARRAEEDAIREKFAADIARFRELRQPR